MTKIIYLDLSGSECGIYTSSSRKIRYTSFRFPGGEVGFKLDWGDFSMIEESDKIVISARLFCGDAIMELLMAVDAIRRIKSDIKIDLMAPFLPYGRQDRVCVKGEALSIKVFANLINSLNFDKVYTLHTHSYVTDALINNLVMMNHHGELISKAFYSVTPIDEGIDVTNAIIVAPDAGAVKATEESYRMYKFNEMVIAGKSRDLETGEILATTIPKDDFEGKDVWIIDDICDGGRTFIELSKVLKTRNVGKLYLIVTHGIFSKRFKVIRPHFDGVFTSDSVRAKEDIPYGESKWADIIEVKHQILK